MLERSNFVMDQHYCYQWIRWLSKYFLLIYDGLLSDECSRMNVLRALSLQSGRLGLKPTIIEVTALNQGDPSFFNIDFLWLFHDQKMKIHDRGTTNISK